jgi:hypothetical protein
MNTKILILTSNSSGYDSLRILLEMAMKELSDIGCESYICSLNEDNFVANLQKLLQENQFKFALCMSGMGLEILSNGKLLWDEIKLPIFNWNCDHPCYFPSRHLIQSKYVFHGYVFPDHAKYSLQHINKNGLCFSLHLGAPKNIFKEIDLPLSSRVERIIFSKSSASLESFENKWATYPTALKQILFESAPLLKNAYVEDFVKILNEVSEKYGILMNGGNKLTMALLVELDLYIRVWQSNMVMKSLKSYPVDVYGNGWDHINLDQATAQYKGSISFPDYIAKLPNYLGCLSLNPLVQDSVHDRVFFGIAAGVPPIHNNNRFSIKNLSKLRSLGFNLSEESIQMAADNLLSNRSDAIEATVLARNELGEKYSMHTAMTQMLHIADLNAFNELA